MPSSQNFPYVLRTNPSGKTALRPLLNVELSNEGQAVDAIGLVDSGADINVLPYEIGAILGLRWQDQSDTIKLSGNMANIETRVVSLLVRTGEFPPVDMIFAWTNIPGAPLIFGQVNFFNVFDVCFHRTKALKLDYPLVRNIIRI